MKSLSNLLELDRMIVNTWLSIPSPWITEIISSSDYDCVTLDLQHGLIDYSAAVSMIQVAKNIVTLVRVPWNEPAMMMRMLDAGAMGIICPMVNNKDEAEKFVQACKYPPVGYRSYGPIRAGFLEEGYFDRANDRVVAIAQIETKQGYENLDEILSAEGLDGIYIGTIDLSISLGIEDHGNLDDDRLSGIVVEIVKKAKSEGKFVAVHTMDLDDVAKVQEMGIDMITPWNDSRTIVKDSRETLEQVKQRLQ